MTASASSGSGLALGLDFGTESVRALLGSMLKKEPDDRPTMEQVAAVLSGTGAPTLPRPRGRQRRRPRTAAVLGLALAAGAGRHGTGYFTTREGKAQVRDPPIRGQIDRAKANAVNYTHVLPETRIKECCCTER